MTLYHLMSSFPPDAEFYLETKDGTKRHYSNLYNKDFKWDRQKLKETKLEVVDFEVQNLNPIIVNVFVISKTYQPKHARKE